MCRCDSPSVVLLLYYFWFSELIFEWISVVRSALLFGTTNFCNCVIPILFFFLSDVFNVLFGVVVLSLLSVRLFFFRLLLLGDWAIAIIAHLDCLFLLLLICCRLKGGVCCCCRCFKFHAWTVRKEGPPTTFSSHFNCRFILSEDIFA